MKRLVAILIAGALLAPAFGLAYTSPGAPTGHVNDFADVLTVEEERALESSLEAFEQETSHEIAVAVIASLEGDDIESYANTLFREWGIGKAEENNGVLLLVALEDRKMRIEVGYGLEGALTDVEAKHVIDNIITPAFRDARYADGIAQGVEAILLAVQEEIVTSDSRNATSTEDVIGVFLFFILMAAIFAWVHRQRKGGKGKRGGDWWRSGGSSGSGGGGFGGGSSGGGGASGGW